MKNTYLLIIILFSAIFFLAALKIIIPTGYLTYQPPSCTYNSSRPEYPNWNISTSENCIVSDGPIDIYGNLSIYGNLTLNNVTLLFNNTGDNITIYSGGRINITRSSNISVSNASYYYFVANSGSNFSMINSYVSYAGSSYDVGQRGLEVNPIMSAFTNNTLTNNYFGLVVYSTNVIANNTFGNNGYFDLGLFSSSNLVENNSMGIPYTLYYSILFNGNNNVVRFNTIEGSLALSNVKNTTIQNNNVSKQLVFTQSGINNVTIVNNIIRVGIGDTGVGLSFVTNAVIANNTISASSSGLYLANGINSINVTNNTITNATSRGIALIDSGSSNLYVSNNTIMSTPIGIETDANNTIIKNNFINNTTNIGIRIFDSDTSFVNVSNNVLTYSSIGIQVAGANNTFINNTINYTSSYGFNLLSTSNYSTISNNTFCYIANSTSNGVNIIGNNTFCDNLIYPENNSHYDNITYFTFNVSNIVFPMSCGLYLDGSYVASNSSVSNNGLSVIYYTPAIGNHNWYVYCNDSSTDYGNSSTFYFEMLPPYVPPSSPPSLPPEQKPEIIKEINFDEMKGASPNIAVIDIPNFPLDSISITPYTPVNNVKIYIGGREEITCKSLNIKRNDNITVNNTTSIVYDCVDLSKENISDDNLKEVEISFKIDGNWLTEKNINITSVRLLRYKSGNWQVLETEPISGKTVTGYAIANTTYIHFRAISPGLSPFVIAGQATTPITLEKVFSYYWLWILLIFIIILIIIYLYRRNKK